MEIKAGLVERKKKDEEIQARINDMGQEKGDSESDQRRKGERTSRQDTKCHYRLPALRDIPNIEEQNHEIVVAQSPPRNHIAIVEKETSDSGQQFKRFASEKGLQPYLDTEDDRTMGLVARDVVVARGQADQEAHEQQSEGNGRSGVLGVWEMHKVQKIPGTKKTQGVEQLLDPQSRKGEPEEHGQRLVGEEEDEDEKTEDAGLEEDQVQAEYALESRDLNTTKTPVRFKWSEQVTDTFCEALVNIIRAGGRSDGGFKTPVWAEVCSRLKKKYGL